MSRFHGLRPGHQAGPTEQEFCSLLFMTMSISQSAQLSPLRHTCFQDSNGRAFPTCSKALFSSPRTRVSTPANGAHFQLKRVPHWSCGPSSQPFTLTVNDQEQVPRQSQWKTCEQPQQRPASGKPSATQPAQANADTVPVFQHYCSHENTNVAKSFTSSCAPSVT